MSTEAYQKLLSGVSMDPNDELAAAEAMLRGNPRAALQLCQLYVTQKRQLREQLAKAEQHRRETEAILEQLREPPWVPGTVLRVCPDGRLDVLSAGRRLIVAADPTVQNEALQPGTEVFLNRELTAVIACSEEMQRSGVVGTVADVADGHVVVRGVGDEEIASMCRPELTAALQPGDRVVYLREIPWVIARLPRRTEQQYTLREAPAVRFADIGGLDHVVAKIRQVLDLHLLQPHLVRAYALRMPRGIVLIGPPGCGKTLLAEAIAGYVGEIHRETRFLSVQPGALRGIYYGQAERRIMELFDIARTHPGPVVIFFDELDSYGARGVGIGQDIDGRVLGTLLTALNGLGAPKNVFCVAATNRLDLCDEALVRSQRLGDFIFTIPRPGREAARQIFSKYLTPMLPYHPAGDAVARATAMVNSAVAYLYAHQGGVAPLATVTFTNGARREVMAPDVVTGAMITSAVEKAKQNAAARHTEADGGLVIDDLLAALDDGLAAEAEKLRAPHAARRLLAIAGAEDIVRVELPRRRIRRHRYLRAA